MGYSETGKGNAARLRANESVAARIEELRARNAEKCQLSRDEAVQYLVEILKTPHRRSDCRSPAGAVLRREERQDRTPKQARRDAAACQKMCGWNEPEKHEFEHGCKAQQDLVEVIVRLRGRGAARNNQFAG